MLEAAFWGLVAASTLIAGAILAIALPWRRRMIGLVAGFGAGALVSALTLDLTVSAFEAAGIPVVVAGLGAGAIAFSAGNWALHRGGAVRHRKRSAGQQAGADPLGIVLGTILDGIPESVVIGISLLAGGGRRAGVPGGRRDLQPAGGDLGDDRPAPGRLVDAGDPRSLGDRGGPERRRGGRGLRTPRRGAVLTMLADTMIPEAFDEAGAAVGLATVLGYASGALLTLV